MADEQVPPASPEIHFEPIVKLPLVEAKTLEEDEEILFQMRAKLFRFDSASEPKMWKERGTGEIKLLKHNKTSAIRILMRRDKTFKICANHYLRPYMKLEPNNTSDRAWVWQTMADFSDEESKAELLACKFENAEKAQKFKTAFEKAREIVLKESAIDLSITNVSDSEEEDCSGSEAETEEVKEKAKEPKVEDGAELEVEKASKKEDGTEVVGDHSNTDAKEDDVKKSEDNKLSEKLEELSVKDKGDSTSKSPAS